MINNKKKKNKIKHFFNEEFIYYFVVLQVVLSTLFEFRFISANSNYFNLFGESNPAN